MSKKLIIIVAGILLLLGGGGGGLYASGMFASDTEETAETETAETETAEAPPPVQDFATYVEMKPIAAPVFNRANRVLFNILVVLSLEVSDAEFKDDVARMMPRLRDRMLRDLYARGVMRYDGSGRFDLDSVKARMLAIAQSTVQGDIIRDVLVISAIRIN